MIFLLKLKLIPIYSLNQKQTNVDLKRSRRQLQRDCGLQDMDNGTYKTVIVVQTNNLGIPGLVTSMDQLYEAK